MKTPVRLCDDRTLPAELVADLQAYARIHPRYDRAAGWAALEQAIAPPPQLSAAAREAPSKLALAVIRTFRIPLLAIAAATLAAIGWSVFDGRSAHTPSAQQRLRATQRVPSVAAQSPVTPPPAARAPALETPAATPEAEPSTAHTPRTTTDGNSHLRNEIAELAQIRSLLARDPRAAYRLAQSGHRAFPAGVLYHEREALAIQALWSLGERQRARGRASLFLTRYPQSPFRARIQALQTDSGEP
jgi:hypothetical protein